MNLVSKKVDWTPSLWLLCTYEYFKVIHYVPSIITTEEWKKDTIIPEINAWLKQCDLAKL